MPAAAADCWALLTLAGLILIWINRLRLSTLNELILPLRLPLRKRKDSGTRVAYAVYYISYSYILFLCVYDIGYPCCGNLPQRQECKIEVVQFNQCTRCVMRSRIFSMSSGIKNNHAAAARLFLIPISSSSLVAQPSASARSDGINLPVDRRPQSDPLGLTCHVCVLSAAQPSPKATQRFLGEVKKFTRSVNGIR